MFVAQCVSKDVDGAAVPNLTKSESRKSPYTPILIHKPLAEDFD